MAAASALADLYSKHGRVKDGARELVLAAAALHDPAHRLGHLLLRQVTAGLDLGLSQNTTLRFNSLRRSLSTRASSSTTDVPLALSSAPGVAATPKGK